MATKSLTFEYSGVGFRFEIGADEYIISDNIENTGVWEDNQLSLYRDLIREDGVFVDVGANVGVNSIYAKLSQPGARVIAIEPEPRNFAILSRNAAGRSIELHNLAIADKPGEMGFEGTGTNAHLSISRNAIKVKCVTLDSFTETIDRINLMKIDVEGFTDLVLAKSRDALSRTSNVIIEFSYGDTERRLTSMGVENPTRADVVRHSEALFDSLKLNFKHFYYISRKDGLVDLLETKDLYEIMFAEASVGDILATRIPRSDAISALAFGFRQVCQLLSQNHMRMTDAQTLAARVDELEQPVEAKLMLVRRG